MTIAYWCVLIAGLMPVLTTAIAKAGLRGYDNAEPRGFMEKQTGFHRRADYAHRNHFEAFPFFAAAVLIAEQLDANPLQVDGLAMAFIAARILYTVLYVANKPTLRSLAWVVGYGCVIALFVIAA
ncbi:hypothetical protein IMCC9480_3216 [Oxalobacteraceae bacterium IMCC9480]|nr:hypothetical protein IMCC9480_3216 [Oxalobacteraceae bacterium IMCC9480]